MAIATRVRHGYVGVPSGHWCSAAIVVHEPTGQTFCAADLDDLSMDGDEWAVFSGGLQRIDGQEFCTIEGCWEPDFGSDSPVLRGLCDDHCAEVVDDARAYGGFE